MYPHWTHNDVHREALRRLREARFEREVQAELTALERAEVASCDHSECLEFGDCHLAWHPR